MAERRVRQCSGCERDLIAPWGRCPFCLSYLDDTTTVCGGCSIEFKAGWDYCPSCGHSDTAAAKQLRPWRITPKDTPALDRGVNPGRPNQDGEVVHRDVSDALQALGFDSIEQYVPSFEKSPNSSVQAVVKDRVSQTGSSGVNRYLSPIPSERSDSNHLGYYEAELRELFGHPTEPVPPLQVDANRYKDEISRFLKSLHDGEISLSEAGRAMQTYCEYGRQVDGSPWSRSSIFDYFSRIGFRLEHGGFVFRDRKSLRRVGYQSVEDYISWPKNRID